MTSEEIARQTQEFLNNGGKITVLPDSIDAVRAAALRERSGVVQVGGYSISCPDDTMPLNEVETYYAKGQRSRA